MKYTLIFISFLLLSCDRISTKTEIIYDTIPVYDTVTTHTHIIQYDTVLTIKDSITPVSGIIIQNVAGQTIIKGDPGEATIIHNLDEVQAIIHGDTITRIWNTDTIHIKRRARSKPLPKRKGQEI